MNQIIFPDPNSELDLLDSDDDSPDELEPSMRDAMAAVETGDDLQPADRCIGLNITVGKHGQSFTIKFHCSSSVCLWGSIVLK